MQAEENKSRVSGSWRALAVRYPDGSWRSDQSHSGQDITSRGGHMPEPKGDAGVIGKIEALVHEEQRLYSGQNLDDSAKVRLEKIQVELDQCWDLLRLR